MTETANSVLTTKFMKARLWTGVFLTVLAFLGSHAPLFGQGRVVVPSDPPLTQDYVDLCRQAFEWMLDVEMTGAERRQYQQLFIESWNRQTKAEKQNGLSYWTAKLSWFSDLPSMTEAQRKSLRETNQPGYL